MKIQFAYLAILFAATGVKSQSEEEMCKMDLACIPPNYDCGQGYTRVWVPLTDCKMCCVTGWHPE
jgi:hypothetical protein